MGFTNVHTSAGQNKEYPIYCRVGIDLRIEIYPLANRNQSLGKGKVKYSYTSVTKKVVN
jgi:hypothetical protein